LPTEYHCLNLQKIGSSLIYVFPFFLYNHPHSGMKPLQEVPKDFQKMQTVIGAGFPGWRPACMTVCSACMHEML